MKIRVLSCLFVMSLTPDFAAFADENDAEFRECAAIDRDADRLGCYDRLMGRGIQAKNEIAAGAVKETDRQPLVSRSPKHEIDAHPATVADNHDVAVAEAPTADELVALVTSVTERVLGHHVVTLNNGQVWQEEFASSYFAVDVGDSVTIRKRFFGGYRLIAESGKGYNVEKIR